MSTNAASIELWDVELPNGDVSTMSLDDLDAAYQAGTIVESTRVRLHGAAEWSTLAAASGIEEAAAPPSAPPAVPSGPQSLAPTAVSVVPSAVELAPEVRADELDELSESAFKRSKKGLVLGALGGVALLAGLTVVGSRALNAADAAQEAMKSAAASKQAFDPRAAMELPPGELENLRAKLTDEQRKRLEEADRKRAEEAARKAAERAAKGAPAGKRLVGEKGEPFVKGGDKYDPLNGSL